MDKEDCIQLLLSTLQKPQWKRSNSITDWDLKNTLWRAGYLLTPEQADALLADTRRRGLIFAHERGGVQRGFGMWGVRVTSAGENWLVQHTLAEADVSRRPSPPEAAFASDTSAIEQEPRLETPVEVGLQQC